MDEPPSPFESDEEDAPVITAPSEPMETDSEKPQVDFRLKL